MNDKPNLNQRIDSYIRERVIAEKGLQNASEAEIQKATEEFVDQKVDEHFAQKGK